MSVSGRIKASFIRPSERIASFKPYFFATLNQKINALKASGMDIIRLDMGSPDLPPDDFIVDALDQAARAAAGPLDGRGLRDPRRLVLLSHKRPGRRGRRRRA